MKFVLLTNVKLLTTENHFILNIAEHENFSANTLVHMRMPTIVGMSILIIRGEKFILS